MKYYLIFFLHILLWGCSPKTDLTSPDGKIQFFIQLDPEGRLSYQIDINKKPFILLSPLGFEEKSGVNLATGFQITHTTFDTKDETWEQPWGENKIIRNHYKEMAVHAINSEKTELIVRVRLFNDGVGFRYEYKTLADSLRLTDELTTFRLAENATTWAIPAEFNTYELLYQTVPLKELRSANTPMTFKNRSGIYASIHEAALTNFPEMNLSKVDSTSLKSWLAAWPDGIKARFNEGSFQTPWRTIQIANQAVGLINSSLILNLNEPCVLQGNLSWIRPMKYIGIWWSMHLGIESWDINDRHGATTEQVKRYIDFAAANNIQGVLAEGWNQGWESWGKPNNIPFNFTKPYADFDIDEITQYAKSKRVELLGHHETGANIPNYEHQLEEAMQWSKAKGINHIKTGYAGGIPGGHHRHAQYAVRHYRKVVEIAAKHKITLNVHEPIKATGIRRTYPNMMSREGARGMEWNAWSAGNPPEHEVILPFTRLLAGPMDYTPGTFDLLLTNSRNHPHRKVWNSNDKGNSRVNTTLAKQLANWVILYSPVQMASDLIEHYEQHPAFQFFRDFDADCDWSKALQGEPGEFIVIVRRAKDKFFLGAATDENPRTIKLPLDFLPSEKVYQAIIYADDKDAHWETNPQAFRIEKKEVSISDTLTIRMANGGGQAISFFEK